MDHNEIPTVWLRTSLQEHMFYAPQINKVYILTEKEVCSRRWKGEIFKYFAYIGKLQESKMGFSTQYCYSCDMKYWKKGPCPYCKKKKDKK